MNSNCARSLDLLYLQFPRFLDEAISSIDAFFHEQKDLPEAIKQLFFTKIREQEEEWNQRHQEELEQLGGDEEAAQRALFYKEDELLYKEFKERFAISPIVRTTLLKDDDGNFTKERWLKALLCDQKLSAAEEGALTASIDEGKHLVFGVNYAPVPPLLIPARRVALSLFQECAGKDRDTLLSMMKVFIALSSELNATKGRLGELCTSASYREEKETKWTDWTELCKKIEELNKQHETMAELAAKSPNVTIGPLYFSKEESVSQDIVKRRVEKSDAFLAAAKVASTLLSDFIVQFAAYRNRELEDASFSILRKIEKVFTCALK